MLGIIALVALALLCGYLAVLAQAAKMLEFRASLFSVLACAVRRELPLGEALASGIRESRPVFQDWQDSTLRRILGGLSDGLPLSRALSRAGPSVVPRRMLAAVEATEGRRDLADTLDALVLEQRLSISHKVGLVVFYLCAMYFLQSFLTVFILPKFIEIFDTMAISLPQSMLVFVRWGPGLVTSMMAIILLLGLYRWWLHRWPLFAHPIQALGYRLPVFGELLRLRAGARLGPCLGPLIRAEQPLHQALTRTAATPGIEPVKKRLLLSGQQLKLGAAPAEVVGALPLPAFFRERMVLALSSGRPEHVAEVVELLGRRCRVRLEQRLQTLSDVMLPLVMLAMGGLVLMTYSFVFVPLADLTERLILW